MEIAKYYPHDEDGPLSPLLKERHFLTELFSATRPLKKSMKSYCRKGYGKEDFSKYIVQIIDDSKLREKYNKSSCKNATSGRGKIIGWTDCSFSMAFNIWAINQIDLLEHLKPVLTKKNQITSNMEAQALSDIISAFLGQISGEELLRRCRFLLGLTLIDKRQYSILFPVLLENLSYQNITLKFQAEEDNNLKNAIQVTSITKDVDNNVVPLKSKSDDNRNSQQVAVTFLPSAEAIQFRSVIENVFDLFLNYEQEMQKAKTFISSATTDLASTGLFLKEFRQKVDDVTRKVEVLEKPLKLSLEKLNSILQPICGYHAAFSKSRNLYASIEQFMKEGSQLSSELRITKEVTNDIVAEFSVYVELRELDQVLSLISRTEDDGCTLEARRLMSSVRVGDEPYLQSLRNEKARLAEVVERKKNTARIELEIIFKSFMSFCKATHIADIDINALHKFEIVDTHKILSLLAEHIRKYTRDDNQLNPDVWCSGLMAVADNAEQIDDVVIKFIRLLLELVEEGWPFSIALRPEVSKLVFKLSTTNPSYSSDMLSASPGIAYALLRMKWVENIPLAPHIYTLSQETLFKWLADKEFTLAHWLLWNRCKEEDDKWWSAGETVLAEYVKQSVIYSGQIGLGYNFDKSIKFLQDYEEYTKLSDTNDDIYTLFLLLAIGAVATGNDKHVDKIYLAINKLNLNGHAELLEELRYFADASIEDRKRMLVISDNAKNLETESKIQKPSDYGQAGIAYEIEEEVILTRVRGWIERARKIEYDKNELLQLSIEIEKFDATDVIVRELRKRAKRPATLKDNVRKSLVNRTKARVDGLLEWINANAQSGKTQTLRKLLLRECKLNLRNVANTVFSIVNQTGTVSSPTFADNTPSWLLFVNTRNLSSLGYFPQFSGWLASDCGNASGESCNAEIAAARITESVWLGNAFDASSQIKKACDARMFYVASQIYNCFPTEENRKVFMAAQSDTGHDIKDGLHDVRQEFKALEEETITKKLDVDVSRLQQAINLAATAESCLISGDVEASHANLKQAELANKEFRVCLTEAETNRNKLIEKILDGIKIRFKEVSTELPLDQLVALRKILNDMTSCKDSLPFDINRLSLLERAFNVAFAGDIITAEQILNEKDSTMSATEETKAQKEFNGIVRSELYRKYLQMLDAGNHEEANNYLFEKFRSQTQESEELVYEVLWEKANLDQHPGISSDTTIGMLSEIRQLYSYSIVDVSLFDADLCNEVGISAGLQRGGDNRACLEDAFKSIKILQYRRELSERLYHKNKKVTMRLYRVWSQLFPDDSRLLVDYGYAAKEAGEFEIAWRAWSRSSSMYPSIKSFDNLSVQCRAAEYYGLAAYYARAAHQLLIDEMDSTNDTNLDSERYRLQKNANDILEKGKDTFMQARTHAFLARAELKGENKSLSKILDFIIRSLVAAPEYWTAGRTLIEFAIDEQAANEIIALAEGINVLEKFLLQLYPKCGHFYYLLSELYSQKGDDNKSREVLNKALENGFPYASRKSKELQQRKLDNLQVGALFCRGRFKVLDRIEGFEGSSGVVIKSIDLENNNRICAVKALRATNRFAADPGKAQERFKYEATIAMSLQNPYIVQTYDFVEDNQVPFIVMEFVDGQPLDAYMQTHGRSSWWDAVNIINQLLMALIYAEGKVRNLGGGEFYHRDLAPRNVMITRDGKVKLLDFGHAQMGSNQRSSSGTLNLRDIYKASETRVSKTWSVRAEIFALGVILYELIAGQSPYDSNEWLEFDDDDPPIYREISSEISIEEGLRKLIANMVKIDPRDRPSGYHIIEDKFRKLLKVGGRHE